MPKKNEIISLDNGFTRNQSNVGNLISTAKTKMTALELKTFYQVTTLIQMDDTDFKEYEISVSDFLRALKISDSNREQVVKLCKRIIRQVFEIEQENGDYIGYTIFSRMHYKHKEQKIAMKFNEEFRPFLLKLKQFTKIQQVKYIIDFESKYAIRIYALLKDYRKMTYRDFNLEALSKIFELPKSYKGYTDIYAKVLQPAIREINAKSDLFVTEPEIIGKKGKKITNIRLYFGNKNEQIGLDFVNELIKRYKRYKSFNVFVNCYYLRNQELKNIRNDIARIKRISTDKNTYFQAFSSDEYGNQICLIGTPNRDDFINCLANGIYKAVSALCEIEKQETLPIFQWQEQKDKLKKIKAMVTEWQDNPTKIFYNCAFQY